MLVLLMASPTMAAEPSIRSLDIRGLRVGGTTTVVIDGDDLGKSPRLLLPFPAKQTLKPDVTDKKATFDVTLEGDVVPGYHHLRVVSDGGVSLPVVVGVDRMAQISAAAPIAELPVAVHGSVAGGATSEFKFQGKAKQRVIVEVEAHRLGSKLRPILHLLTPKKLQLAWSWAMPSLHGDTRIEAVLPEDGQYTVTLHDVEYAAAAPSFYRLKIGEWSYVDQVFPGTVAKDQAAKVELVGMPSAPSASVAALKGPQVMPIAWPGAGLWSGPRPYVTVSSYPEIVKTTTKDKLQELPEGPVGVTGKLAGLFEEDRYRVAVKPGTKVRLEVFAERLGSPIDAALVVRNDKGDQLARAEDSTGTLDPVLEYTVPDKVTSITLGVVDSQGRAGTRGIYRLVIEPAGSAREFRLTTPVQRVSLAAGGRTVIPVHVERKGYAGKIDLMSSLPAGVKLDGAMIPEGADGTLLTLERGDAPFDAVVAALRGRGADGVEHPVSVKGHPLERIQPWLAHELALAPSNIKAAEFVVDWEKLPPDAVWSPGTKLALPVKATRTNPKTSVKLSLLTSQVAPLANNQPDPNKTIRQEKPIEIPVNMPGGEVVALVPADLPAPVYDVTVQAELLDAAKKPIAIAYTPVRRLAVRIPLVVKLDGPSRLEATIDPKKGATLKLSGKVERLGGLKSDVALTLTGLPAGAKADAVTVKADASDFVINVNFPPTAVAGETKGIKLSGSFAPEPKTPAVRVKSRDVEVELVLKAAPK